MSKAAFVRLIDRLFLELQKNGDIAKMVKEDK